MQSFTSHLRVPSWLLLTGCLQALLPLSAAAQAPSLVSQGTYYLGGSISSLQADKMSRGTINQALQGQGLSVTTTRADDSATSWKLFTGYRFTPYWGIEAGYTDLGKYDFDGQVIADPGIVRATFKAESWNLMAVGILPVNDTFEVFGKAGMGYWRTELEASGTFSAQNARTVKANGTSPVFGVGATMRLMPKLQLRLEWERFHEIGEASGSGRSDIDMTSLGLQYTY